MSLQEQLAAAVAAHDSEKDSDRQRAIYHADIFPLLCTKFSAMPPDERPIDVLLVPVSNQHSPVLAAARWRPRLMVAIYSDVSAKHRGFVESQIERLSLGVTCDGVEITNIDANPALLYERIKQVIQPHLRAEPPNPHIAVDITGGTSVMSVGAAMAVSLVGGRFFYIRTPPHPENISRRQVGAEVAEQFHDPYVVFGDLKADEACNLAARHDYLGAQRAFDELTRSEGLATNQRERFTLLATIAQAYAAWDAFDLKGALAALVALPAVIWDRSVTDLPAELVDSIAPSLWEQRARLQSQRAVLERLSLTSDDMRDSRSTFAILRDDRESVLALLGSLYANALRREQQSRFDFAALLLYRSLELVSRRRLALIGIDAEDPRLGLAAQFRRLRERHDTLVAGFDVEEINRTSTARNKSLLAHGFRQIGEAEYSAFRAVADTVIDRFLQVEAQKPFASWSMDFSFVTLK